MDEPSFKEKAPKPVIVLREWMEINPSSEFRCFVKNGHLYGMYLGENKLLIGFGMANSIFVHLFFL